MAGRPRTKMSIENRAKQFMPFAADALAAKEKIVVEKIELSSDMEEELNRKMHGLCKGMIATVVYFENYEYLKVTGMVAKIDIDNRVLQIVDHKISFENIYTLDYIISYGIVK